ncbi:hypothetical protein [Hyphococcus lacteus]|uniref:DUF2946 domain-containing protein n=1 Tax=Hyphococcus lacteus TaxID=3143536 RepID=A0ABV3Z724_9PROT
MLKQSGIFARLVRTVLLCATLLMLAGAAHAAAHDHDQRPDLDGECIICTATAINVVKALPIEPSISEPETLFNGIRWDENEFVVGGFNSASRYARGPPLLLIHSN